MSVVESRMGAFYGEGPARNNFLPFLDRLDQGDRRAPFDLPPQESAHGPLDDFDLLGGERLGQHGAVAAATRTFGPEPALDEVATDLSQGGLPLLMNAHPGETGGLQRTLRNVWAPTEAGGRGVRVNRVLCLLPAVEKFVGQAVYRCEVVDSLAGQRVRLDGDQAALFEQEPQRSLRERVLVGCVEEDAATQDAVEPDLILVACEFEQVLPSDDRPVQFGQALGLLLQCLRLPFLRDEAPHLALGGLAHGLPGEQAGAGVHVEHEVMPFDAGQLEDALALSGEALPCFADGALQPALPGAVAGAVGEYLRRSAKARIIQHRRQLRLPAASHIVTDAVLKTLLGRLVEDLPLQGVRQVLLGHPMVAVGVRVEVALAVPEALLGEIGR